MSDTVQRKFIVRSGPGSAPLVTYTPATPADWPVPPNDVAEALDDLAAVSPSARLIASGVATLIAPGMNSRDHVDVLSTLVTANSRFVLTAQDGGAGETTGTLQIGWRDPGVSFTIQSSSAGADTGRIVYWQMWES